MEPTRWGDVEIAVTMTNAQWNVVTHAMREHEKRCRAAAERPRTSSLKRDLYRVEAQRTLDRLGAISRARSEALTSWRERGMTS